LAKNKVDLPVEDIEEEIGVGDHDGVLILSTIETKAAEVSFVMSIAFRTGRTALDF
jgi:hypothetical protein